MEGTLTQLALQLQSPISSLIGVVTFIGQPQPWSIGVVASHVWSVLGPSNRSGVRVLARQLFVSVNLPRGWYIDTSPLVASANGNAGPARDVWTIPVGGGVGNASLLDGQPISTLLAAYRNAIRPSDIPSFVAAACAAVMALSEMTMLG